MRVLGSKPSSASVLPRHPRGRDHLARAVRVASTAALAVTALATVASSPPAAAQTKPARPTEKVAALPKIDVAPALPKLKSGDAAQIKEGLELVMLAGKSSGTSAAPAVADALAQGLSPELTELAISVLAELEVEASSAVLSDYAVHRNAKIRRSAIKALTRTKGARAAEALRKGLSDGDAAVRGFAASGLGAIKAKDAVGDLNVALDHRVNEAAASIGALCTSDQCDAFTAKLGKLPFDVVTGGLEAILARPAGEVSDDAKVRVVERVRGLGTAEANRFLRELQKRWPKDGSPKVRAVVDQAVQATGGASGGDK